jgi:hypothetical protein
MQQLANPINIPTLHRLSHLNIRSYKPPKLSSYQSCISLDNNRSNTHRNRKSHTRAGDQVGSGTSESRNRGVSRRSGYLGCAGCNSSNSLKQAGRGCVSLKVAGEGESSAREG